MQHKNPLIVCIKESKTTAELKDAIAKLGIDAVRYASEMDDKKLLPHEYCRYYHFDKRNFEVMCESIFQLMIQQKIKPLNEMIDAETVISEYEIKSTSSINNVKAACEAINYARGIIKFSSTHPTINMLTSAERNRLDMTYETIITQRVREMMPEFGNCDKLPEFKSPEHMKRYLAFFEKFSKATGYGNCGDFSRIIFLFISKKYPKLIQDVRFIKNGDHWFNQIGSGESAVYCDGFLGLVAPASKIHTALKDVVDVDVRDSYYSCLVSFNPNHHKIVVEFNNNILLPRLLTNNQTQLSKNEIPKEKNKLIRSFTFP